MHKEAHSWLELDTCAGGGHCLSSLYPNAKHTQGISINRVIHDEHKRNQKWITQIFMQSNSIISSIIYTHLVDEIIADFSFAWQ